MPKHREEMWAIAGLWHNTGKRFLYTGTYLTRRDAIRIHSKGKRGYINAWKECRKMGDRAVKVIVEWSDAD